MYGPVVSNRTSRVIGILLVLATVPTGSWAEDAVTPMIEIHAPSDARDPTTALTHPALGLSSLDCSSSSGKWLVDQETVFSAKGSRSVQDGIEATDAFLSLPEGSLLKVVFDADRIITERLPDRTRLTLHNGEVRVIDSDGTVRATVHAGGVLAQDSTLQLDATFEHGEINFRVHAFSADGHRVPVRIKLDARSSSSESGKRQNHGAVRWKMLPSDEAGKPLRLKMQFIYDRQRLCQQIKNDG